MYLLEAAVVSQACTRKESRLLQGSQINYILSYGCTYTSVAGTVAEDAKGEILQGEATDRIDMQP